MAVRSLGLHGSACTHMLYDVDTAFVNRTEETRGNPRLMRQLKSEVTPFRTTKAWRGGSVGPCIGFMDGQLHVPTAAPLEKRAMFDEEQEAEWNVELVWTF